MKSMRAQLKETATEIERAESHRAEELKQVQEKLDSVRTPPNSIPANINSISSMGTSLSSMTDIRTTEQALLILANAIDRAWMKSKMVTLVAFDLKNAFNGVNGKTIDTRLREKGIPEKARNWIR